MSNPFRPWIGLAEQQSAADFPRYVLVTYRFRAVPDKAAADQRRKDLTEYLQLLPGAKHIAFEDGAHVSTSAWLVRYAYSAAEFYKLIEKFIDRKADLLEVMAVDVRDYVHNPEAETFDE